MASETSETSETSEGVGVRVDSAGRRRFSAGEKRRIVAEYSEASSQTERGVVLRRWGTYQQSVSRWRRKIADGTLEAGRTPKEFSSKDRKKLRTDLHLVEQRLNKARAENETLKELIRAQGKALGQHAETADSPKQV